MNDLYVALGIAAVLSLSHWLAYRNGLNKERAEHEKEKNDAVLLAKKARDQLSNPVFVKRLHDKFKR